MAIESIAKTLGTGSGVDVTALVTGLVEASFANKNKALTAKSETLTTQISKVGELKSTISDFASALAALTSGGTLATQPTSARSDVLTVTRLAGADLTGFNASVEVRQLAQGQVASTNAFAGGKDSVIGTGTLTLTFGSATVAGNAMTDFTPGPAAPITITVDAAHNTLDGVAKAINAANAGVTASIMTDASGARLVVKGASGASQAFELTGTGDLAQLNIGRTATASQVNSIAQDALLALDGVETRYATNSVYGLIEGVRIDLVSAAVGTRVAIGARPPTTEINQTITNFVETYNAVYKLVKAATNAVDGPLRGDPAAKDLLRQLKGMTLATLLPDAAADTPKALADIGIATQRDGMLSVDTARLANVVTSFPRNVEAIFAQGAGLTKALSEIASKATNKDTGLGVSQANYEKAQTKVADEKEDVLAATEKLRSRMTQQFAAMDAKVAAYKSTQSFLEQQVKAWNGGD
ncbi:flagellar filament capping protein FliD [Sphingomonas psychrotolerans]|uniref:Flagellar hook-associated protein 2 n=1 Tax=Sphingomonas psychrotolerans TaxID=1327635 RepID=A0A2K8MJ27_9SPHN|nr:flagellar filament capping protein FliD [Sphingomonas psychrotolerans]ATY33004.1 flagellar hook protein [Sphingomonas psychrotolerans]